MVLLKESLQRSAENAIKGIKPIPANYNWMIETLKKRFSNQPVNRSKIVKRLFDLPHAGKKADSCQSCLDSITTLVHQMVSAGYDIRQTCDPMWIETVIEKFPYEIVKDVLIKNQEVDNITIQELLDIREKEIAAKAYVELRLGFDKTSLALNQGHDKFSRTQQCVFCDRSNHASAACRTVARQTKRREILKQYSLCWKCFSGDHPSNECAKPSCKNCGRTHHSSLCLMTGNMPSASDGPRQLRFDRLQKRNEPTRNNTYDRGSSGPNNRHVATSNNDGRNHFQPNDGHRFIPSVERPKLNNQLVENDHSTVSTVPKHEQLILMTAEVNIFNHIS
ncbi:hypothetical protein OESDEN_15173 [Oesophagostomum dentatum]|uniref:Zinc knuckle n=1 Tax=Oesophagostomum dentatum TaxID=61180 RepID=A0A0B1SMK2_OESDE|nr:hypothetical protein OESDEN_15173 [Oesophagostomum dentatum]